MPNLVRPRRAQNLLHLGTAREQSHELPPEGRSVAEPRFPPHLDGSLWPCITQTHQIDVELKRNGVRPA